MTSDPLHLITPQPPRRRWLVPVLVTVAVLVLGVTAALLVPRLLGGSSVTVKGQVDLLFEKSNGNDHNNCFGTGGLSDLKGGAQVVITDTAGATVAVTSLRPGVLDLSGDPYLCVLRFEASAPAGKGFYGVQIANRDRVQYPEAQLGQIKLSVG